MRFFDTGRMAAGIALSSFGTQAEVHKIAGSFHMPMRDTHGDFVLKTAADRILAEARRCIGLAGVGASRHNRRLRMSYIWDRIS